ncbi:hypothetical protein GW17_00012438 [Ensete ventricosum]|nr:hypothetical protein GW17_00012438 [Ensete ventricosum]RZR88701.1 hypothetical protein BHM03_00016316 [Ensete ventricosum]
MSVEKQKFLTVAPFKCVWREELRFKEAGRGCVAFEAFAQNDVTLVFREQVGSQHYHYKMDNNPNYTIIFGSHRNRRLKIEASGKTVVDVAGVGLCSSAFQSYWIGIYDGLISIGKGKYPFQNLVFEWHDSEPNFNVQYIGLSSWDKHVGYRNISILHMPSHHNALWSHIDYTDYGEDDEDDGLENVNDNLGKWGLPNFLENWDLADVLFEVGTERKVVPAHKNKKLFDSGKKVEIINPSSQVRQFGIFPCEVPLDIGKLKHFLATGEHSDIKIHIGDHGLVVQSHKLILSLWSAPFAKVRPHPHAVAARWSLVSRRCPRVTHGQFFSRAGRKIEATSGQFASWPVIGPMALLPFRFFRVVLTGPASGDANVWNLCICFIELYGYFI